MLKFFSKYRQLLAMCAISLVCLPALSDVPLINDPMSNKSRVCFVQMLTNIMSDVNQNETKYLPKETVQSFKISQIQNQKSDMATFGATAPSTPPKEPGNENIQVASDRVFQRSIVQNAPVQGANTKNEENHNPKEKKKGGGWRITQLVFGLACITLGILSKPKM